MQRNALIGAVKLLTGRRFGVVALIVGIGAAVGGIAYASIPDSNGVVHGCYQKNNGNLRVIDSTGKGCTTSEKPLNWSQTGPSGLTGSTGATGATGPSDGGFAHQDSLVAVDDGSESDIASTASALPAGDYVWTAEMFILVTSGPPIPWCRPQGAPFHSSDFQRVALSSDWFTFIGTLHLSGDQVVTLKCAEEGGIYGYKALGSLILTRVGTLH